MRCISLIVAVVVIGASSALAGISVTSYYTLASTNGFAPSLQGPYLAEEKLENVSPALAEVSGDWTGPNADGTPETWHFVGTSRASSTTTFDVNSYTVTAAGSFEYAIDTTANFVDPRPSVLTPGGGSNYEGFFSTNLPVSYQLTGQLNLRGRVRMNSLSGLVIFDQRNSTPTPMAVNFTGMVPAGQYQVLFTTSLAAPGPLPGGVHYEASGGFEDVVFSVQVPEPHTLGFVIMIVATTLRGRNRCAGAT